MNYEEALKELKYDNEERDWDNCIFDMAGGVYDKCVEALEKQIPKKLNYMADDDTCVYYHWECPNCGNYYGHSIKKGLKALYGEDAYYCSRCGQAIDWSEVE